jgi:hypothetical protein
MFRSSRSNRTEAHVFPVLTRERNEKPRNPFVAASPRDSSGLTVHADDQYPACGSFSPSGSSCVRNKPPLQAHQH